jgi:drug/metabolite transporter (DMT)-like permease
MVGIAPFCAAVLGWLLLRERLGAVTLGSMVIALAGMFVMVGGELRPGEVVGIILALYSAFCFSCYSVLLRWGQRTDMTVAQLWNAIYLILFSGAVLMLPIPLREEHGMAVLTVGWHNLSLIVIMGAVQLSLGMILFTRGSRSVPAGELALLSLIEPTLGPLWVFLAVGEVPSAGTLIGGAVIMAAIVIQIVFGAVRREKAAPAPQRPRRSRA